VDFEQMPSRGGVKVMVGYGDASRKPFVQTDFSVNKWSAEARRDYRS
jgi:hypothetical protein